MSQMDFTKIWESMGQMRSQVEQIKARVDRMQIVGEAGAGMVRVTVNGEGKALKIEIDPVLLSASEKPMLEELIVSAINDAAARARETLSNELRHVAGGAGIPGLEKLFGL
ncbi:MAG: YbaB/EbfC family nucleoid-associated protein [Leptospirales bacterium]|nr:YbaB/EbfC family nucleoid-associated protein [Leptospirales bacterium]